MIKAKLLKPLDGHPEGSIREFDKEDFDRLVGFGAVEKAGATDVKAAPTVANKVAKSVANKAD